MRLEVFLLNSLWQVPVVILAAWVGERLLRRGPARLRHLLWLAALAGCVLLPAAIFLPERETPRRFTPSNVVPEETAPPGGWPSHPISTSPPVLPPFVLNVVAILYGISVLGYGIRMGMSWHRTRALVREASPAALSGEALAIARRCREAFGLDEVAILVSGRIPGPVTAGSTILLPPFFLSNSTPDELTSALGHEMAHVRRRDYALHLAGEIFLLPVAFHPAVRVLRRRLAETREMSCDEAVVERLIGARAYARSLLSMAASIAGLPRPALTLGVQDADTLEVRMKRLTDPRSRLGRRLALASLSLALLLLAGTGVAASSLALEAPDSQSGSSAWSPFLGTWRTEFPSEDGEKLPGSDLEVRMSNGKPEAILTLYRHKNQTTEPVDIPAYDLRVDGQTLTFRFRTAIRYREGARKEILEHTNQLQLTGRDEAVLRWLGGKHSADPSQIPPPPPPQTARRIG